MISLESEVIRPTNRTNGDVCNINFRDAFRILLRTLKPSVSELIKGLNTTRLPQVRAINDHKCVVLGTSRSALYTQGGSHVLATNVTVPTVL